MVEGFFCRCNVDALSLTQAMISFEFCLSLRIVERHMSYTESLTLALQAKAVDIVQGVEHVSTLKNVFSDARSHIGTIMYERVSRHAQIYSLAPQTPRRCVRQAGRHNHP